MRPIYNIRFLIDEIWKVDFDLWNKIIDKLSK